MYGIKRNPSLCRQVESMLQVQGVNEAEACSFTGRLLVRYDTTQLSTEKICFWLQRLEEQIFAKSHPDLARTKNEEGEQLVAVAVEESLSASHADSIPSSFQAVVSESSSVSHQQPSPLLMASVIGLGALGIKQMTIGKTAMARSPGLFHASAGLAVLSGYPVLKQGFERLTKEKTLNADLVLGTAAVALALLRENLLALGAASLIQYLHWQRSKNQEPNLDPSLYLTKKTKAYATKWGFGLAGISWLTTRNPWVSLGILLAANPRPSLASEEYAWKQAEHQAQKQGQMLPRNSSLCRISELEYLVVADTSYVYERSSPKLSCISSKKEEAWSIARSLVDKVNHPYKQEIEKAFLATGKTKRTAFEVKQEDDGIRGKLNGHSVYLGTKSLLAQNRVKYDQYELEAKRLQRKGMTVYYVGLQEECIGLLVDESEPMPNSDFKIIKRLKEANPQLQVGYLKNSMGIKKAIITESHLQYLKRQGVSYLLVINEQDPASTDHRDEPRISRQHLMQLPSMIQSAKAIHLMTTQHRIWTMLWNMLGTGLAFSGRITAPVVNLLADALKLLLLSKSSRIHQKSPGPSAPIKRETKPSGWHGMGQTELLQFLNTDLTNGLNNQTVQSLRKQIGANRLVPAEKTPWYLSFVKQFTEFTTVILLATAVVSILAGDVFDGVAMTAVLLVNACISTTQESKAEKMVEALNSYQPPKCKVIRESEIQEISALDLVPGDIVQLEAGDQVPADLRILTAWNLEVNEAPLTGESLSIQKKAGLLPKREGEGISRADQHAFYGDKCHPGKSNSCRR